VDRRIASIQTRIPQTDLWAVYENAAIAAGHIPEAIQRLQTQIAVATNTDGQRLKLLGLLIDAHARVGDLRGLAEDYKQAISLPRSPSDPDVASDALSAGLASGDAELIKIGIAHDMANGYAGLGTPLFKALSEQGRLADLERLQLEDLKKPGNDIHNSSATIQNLFAIYYQANRPADVLALLKGFPFWPDDDISEPDEDWAYHGIETRSGPGIAFTAAWAFGESGQKIRAVRTLRHELLASPDFPEPYELLNRIDGAPALKIYDELILARPMDALPVLWKGDLLFRLGCTKQAEACVRRAITLDPVRDFVYREKLNDLFGRILLKEGDEAGSAKCERLVEAVGLASKAADCSKWHCSRKRRSCCAVPFRTAQTTRPCKPSWACAWKNNASPARPKNTS
jgi:tetratricopeptide (TPR) repeat protein